VVSVNIVTSSIARGAKRPYLINSEADFEVFRPPPRGDTLHRWVVKLSTDYRKLQPEMEICNRK